MAIDYDVTDGKATKKKKQNIEEYLDPRLDNGWSTEYSTGGADRIKTKENYTQSNQLGGGSGNGGGVTPTYLQDIPTYTSPYAGATYQYSGGAMPTFNYGASGRPTYNYAADPLAAFSYDVAKPADFQHGEARPEYAAKYDDQISQMVDQILNRGKFEYDYNQDPLYQMYAEAYGRNGRQAMEDTLAQVSARTGGLASSYAGTAAQQAYNRYMDALNEKVPELYQMAYEMYRNEGDDMRNNLGIVQGLDTRDYGRYQDQLGQWNTDRNMAYSQWQTGLDQWNADRDMAWKQYQNQQDQWNADRDFAWKKYLNDLDLFETDRNWAYKDYQNQLDQYNKDRSYDYQVWKDALSRNEAAAQAAYNSQVDAVTAKNNAALAQAAQEMQQQAQPKAANYESHNADKDTGSVQKVEVAPGTYVYEFEGVKYNPNSDAEVENLLDRINHMPLSDSKKMSLANDLKKLGANISVK